MVGEARRQTCRSRRTRPELALRRDHWRAAAAGSNQLLDRRADTGYQVGILQMAAALFMVLTGFFLARTVGKRMAQQEVIALAAVSDSTFMNITLVIV